MANLRIIVPNIADTGVGTLSESPALLTTLPGTNLQMPTERGKTARTTGLSSQDVKLTYAANQRAGAIAVCRHNLTTSGTIRGLLYSDAAWTTSILDSTATAAFSTSGLDTKRDVYTDANFRGLKNWVYWGTEQTTVRSAKVTLADGSNPDGFMEANRIFIGPYVELAYNPAHGSVDVTLIDSSGRERAYDGTMLINVGYRARRMAINLEYIEDAGDLATLLAIERLIGTTTEVFVSLYPGQAGAKEIYHQMACRIVDSPTFNPHQYGLHKNSIVFEET